MNYNVRIGDNFLKADHVDGEVLQHTDLNELESVVKTAINANYTDIQKLQNGVLSVTGAESLKGTDGVATLSQFINESLQESDNKVPTSLQVRKFIENLLAETNLSGVYNIVLTGTYTTDSASNTLLTNEDANKIKDIVFPLSVGRLITLNINFGGIKNLIGELTVQEFSEDNKKYSSTIELTGIGINNILKATINLLFTTTDGVNWVNDDSYSKIRMSS